MLNILCAAGFSVAAALGAPFAPAHRSADLTADTTLATRLTGRWTGHRSAKASEGSWDFTMDWSRGPDGRLTGMIHPQGRAAYPVRLIWSSGNDLVFISAPHRDRVLKEEVVTRGEVTLDGRALDGTLELRPTRYEGRTVRGRIHAVEREM